ncbi:hypothetical protein DFJ43DRAFT_284286 [Lentinula guzmanii]|uniref:DUF6534 domain-containing protein n=1 Tax=Lentinula guzmanii TaxID=2804957 RepID=A0AA38N0E4_9AGAR|nr:hypothetical protein DFJ43DRAFT_284286 [Lentinula guzmanii]
MYNNHTSLPYHSFINHASVYDGIPGAVLLDGILQSFLLGFVLGQATKYFSVFKDDRWQKRLFVGVVVLLSLTQTIIEDFKLWQISVNKSSWAHSQFVWTGVAINGCISWLCEIFYIRRCWKMTDHNPWVLYPLGTLSITVIIANFIQAVCLPLVLSKTDPHSGNYFGGDTLMESLQFVFSYWVFGSLVLDLIVASILITTLWRAKTGLEDSDRVVWSVITLTCESAALPCISMIAAGSLFHSNKEGNLVLFFLLLSGKLYSYGLLRTLNSRDGFRLRLNSNNLGRATLGDCHWDRTNGSHTHLSTAVATISEPPKSLDTTSLPHFYEAVHETRRSDEVPHNEMETLSPTLSSNPRTSSSSFGSRSHPTRRSSSHSYGEC